MTTATTPIDGFVHSLANASAETVRAISQMLGPQTTSEEVLTAIAKAHEDGFVPGTTIYEPRMGRFRILGYNTDTRGSYSGERFPLRLCRLSDGYIDVYGPEQFNPPHGIH